MTGNVKLNDLTVRSLPAVNGDAFYPDSDKRYGVPGLYLRVRKEGARTFIIQWRQGGKQRRSTVGKVGVLTLDDARKAARKLLVGIDEGNDPVVVRARARMDDQQEFLTLAKTYLVEREVDMKPLSLEQCKLHLLHYWKAFHKLPVAKIDRSLVAAELRLIADGRGAVAADRGRSTLSSFFAWCIGNGTVALNPVIGTNKASKNVSRDRVLTDAELAEIWNAAGENDYGRIVRLLTLTGQRRDEIAGLLWREVNAEDRVISLSKERTKNGRAHDVPLSDTAFAIIDGLPVRDDRDHVFGAGEGGFSGYSKSKVKLDAAILTARKEAAAKHGGDPEKVKPLAHWTLHDLRRTMATRMADLGVLPHVIEAVLNHVSGHKAGVAGIYNRSTYATEKRAAVDLWASHVLTIAAQANGANVVRLHDKMA